MGSSFAQELNVQVTINTPKLQTVDPKVFETLETAIQEFMNNQKWTDFEYEQEERIQCNIQLTIDKEVSATSFEAELAIQASRPVYNSGYETVLLNHRDKDVQFEYQQFQPLEYAENSYNNNLTAILAFYAYVIIGMDEDSFAPLGGTPYLQTAQDILNNVPSSAAARYPGWRSLDSNRNRYWMMENLLSPRVRPYREAMYDYHRHGLDVMAQNPDAGRAIIADALSTKVADVNRTYPNTMILQMFTNAKRSEIISIFQQSPVKEKNVVIQVMAKVDKANSSEYQKIRRS